jgi:hypothetical protein
MIAPLSVLDTFRVWIFHGSELIFVQHRRYALTNRGTAALSAVDYVQDEEGNVSAANMVTNLMCSFQREQEVAIINEAAERLEVSQLTQTEETSDEARPFVPLCSLLWLPWSHSFGQSLFEIIWIPVACFSIQSPQYQQGLLYYHSR